jgi:hypothetical protein
MTGNGCSYSDCPAAGRGVALGPACAVDLRVCSLHHAAFVLSLPCCCQGRGV